MNNASNIFDVIIIGGGPAGYTAGLYCARAGLNSLLFEKFSPGGQMTQTSQIDNYPGFDEGVDGFTLGFKMEQGAKRFGLKSLQEEVLSVDLIPTLKEITTDGGTYFAKAVIIATGAEHRHLGIDKEKDLLGRGVGYCAACDGMFYKNKTVAVVGGGNSAAADALLLSRLCEKVYLIHRRDSLRATRIYHEPLKNTSNIEVKFNSTVEQFLHGATVTGISIKNVLTGKTEELKCDGVFISIGRSPVTKLFANQLDIDEKGYIMADESTRTSLPGVFAVGDVRTKKVRQIVTATADGAVAAHYVEEYIEQTK